jgi:hypothetical protein
MLLCLPNILLFLRTVLARKFADLPGGYLIDSDKLISVRLYVAYRDVDPDLRDPDITS